MLDLGVLIVLVYSIVETLEKFGIKRKYAHLIAIPLGMVCSFIVLQGSIQELIIKGLLIGFGSVGTCDTTCNIVDLIKSKNST